MKIELTDNNRGKLSPTLFNRKDISSLYAIADKDVAQLCKEHDNLLLFPYSIDKADDQIGKTSVINLLNTSDPDKVQIQTGNVMGFIGMGNLQVRIKSRFDKAEGKGDFFLHYMLQKVLSYNLFDLYYNSHHEDVFDFTMFMFPYFLKRALQQGIYREYQHFHHNDSKIKGTIDLNRHVAHNMPFISNVAYSTHEYAYDNSMTELIRHTIEVLKTKSCGQAVLSMDRETIDSVKTIVAHTPSYSKSECEAIICKNLRHKIHPYYTAYQPLQSVCLQILRMEKIKYGEVDDEICGILFDGAWLWEEYVYTILKNESFVHPENKKRTGGLSLFEDRSGIIYPDFYKRGEIVLDAKYKRLESKSKVSEVGREDLYQLITYVTHLKAAEGGFVIPLTNRQQQVPCSKLKNPTSTLFILGIEVCHTATTYTEFCQKMKENERHFIRQLHQQTYLSI